VINILIKIRDLVLKPKHIKGAVALIFLMLAFIIARREQPNADAAQPASEPTMQAKGGVSGVGVVERTAIRHDQLESAIAVSKAPTSAGPPVEPRRDFLSNFDFDVMAQRADQSDAHAACILRAAILVCSYPVDLESFQRVIMMGAGEEPKGSANARVAIERLLRLESFEPRRKKLCEKITGEQLAQFEARNHQAARLGVAKAAIAYFLNPGSLIGADGKADEIRTGEYRREAVPLLERAAQKGDVEALNLLFGLYSTGRYAGVTASIEVPVDRARAMAIGIELIAISNPMVAADVEQALIPLKAEMKPTDWASVEQIGRAYRAPRSSWDLSDWQEPDQQIENCGA